MMNKLWRLCLLAAIVIDPCSAQALAAPFCAVFNNERQCSFYDMDECRFWAGTWGFCMYNEEAATARAPFCVVTSYATRCSFYDPGSCRHAAADWGGACVANARR